VINKIFWSDKGEKGDMICLSKKKIFGMIAQVEEATNRM
jgi:hypothetical protein